MKVQPTRITLIWRSGGAITQKLQEIILSNVGEQISPRGCFSTAMCFVERLLKARRIEEEIIN